LILGLSKQESAEEFSASATGYYLGKTEESQTTLSMVPTEGACIGKGRLKLSGGILKFHLDKNHSKKPNDNTTLKIPVDNIDRVEQSGNEISLFWNGVIDKFVIENPALLGILHEKITLALNERQMLMGAKELALAKQIQRKYNEGLNDATKLIDSLFDFLKSLHGRIDWGHLEKVLNNCEQNAKIFIGDNAKSVNLDFSKVKSALIARIPEETAKETFSLLKTLYDYFSGLASNNQPTDQDPHNYQDVAIVVTAYYTLNDIMLGAIVADAEVQRECEQFLVMLEGFSKKASLKIDLAAFKDALAKLTVGKFDESVLLESRLLFRKQVIEH